MVFTSYPSQIAFSTWIEYFFPLPKGKAVPKNANMNPSKPHTRLDWLMVTPTTLWADEKLDKASVTILRPPDTKRPAYCGKVHQCVNQWVINIWGCESTPLNDASTMRKCTRGPLCIESPINTFTHFLMLPHSEPRLTGIKYCIVIVIILT